MASIHKKTVAFIEATDWLKNELKIDYGEIARELGLSRSQINMIRVHRRKIKSREIEKLVIKFPDTKIFFENIDENHSTLSTSEPPAPKYGLIDKLMNHLEYLIELQKKRIEKLEKEVDVLESENHKLKTERTNGN